MTKTTAMSLVTFESVTTSEGFDRLEKSWDTLHRVAKGLVFQTFQWNRLWWKLYGEGLDLHIVLFKSGDDLIGVLPMYREPIKFGVCTVHRMKLLGTYEIYGEYAPLIHPDFIDALAGSLAKCCESLVESGTTDIVEFFRFTPDSLFMRRLRESLDGLSTHSSYAPVCMARVQMELPGTWQEYVGSLSSSERNLLHRREKSLAKQGVALEVIKDPIHAEEAFADFIRLHTSSWSGRGFGGYFEQFRHFGAFHSEMTSTLMRSGNARLYFYVKDGKRVAAVHAYFVNDSVCFYLSGLDRDHELVRYSPGRVLLTVVIRHAIEEGYRIFDFQGGDEEYKFRLGGKLSSFSKLTVWCRHAPLRVRLFFAVQSSRRYIQDAVLNQYVIPAFNRLLSTLRGHHKHHASGDGHDH
jgi:CelD/BcsL family acetyltransferase involved in cellulose biosynthesis